MNASGDCKVVIYHIADENVDPETIVSSLNKLYIKIIAIFFLLLFLTVILIFVIFPIVFMLSTNLQTLFMFMNVNLPTDDLYYEMYNETGYRNLYVTVKDFQSNQTIRLGAWHLLPHNLTNDSIADKNYNYDAALANSNYSVILYFHGTGESRSNCLNMYQVLRNVSHVIAFDYRNFADSSTAVLTEDTVVNDAVQVYEWLCRKTNSSIYIWGHSLGTALATRTVSILKSYNLIPMGLFLESPFTSMREELPVHKYGRFFSWLPWFRATVLDPLYKNGLRFETDKHILQVDCPIMIMHAEDDSVVPYTLGLKLYHIAQNNRNSSQGQVIYYQFAAKLHYDHFSIYEEPKLTSYIENFMNISNSYSSKRTGIDNFII